MLAMTANLISKERLYGMTTSGGSESLIMSLYAYKNYAKKERPNVYIMLYSEWFQTLFMQQSIKEPVTSISRLGKLVSIVAMRLISSIWSQ